MLPDVVYDALAAGEAALVATDTVIGLAALPGSAGVRRIYELKGRPASQPLPWLVPGIDALDRYAVSVSPAARALAGMFWPGALTLIVKASPAALALGSIGESGTLALRCPDAPQLIQLMQRLESPLACTSANLHGQPATSNKHELPQSFHGLAGYKELLEPTSAFSGSECGSEGDVTSPSAPPDRGSCRANARLRGSSGASNPQVTLASAIVDTIARPIRILREGAIPTQALLAVAAFDR